MIKKEFYGYSEKYNENMYRTYSDEGYFIRQIKTGNVYEEAIDLESKLFTYEETDIPIVEEIDENQENQGI